MLAEVNTWRVGSIAYRSSMKRRQSHDIRSFFKKSRQENGEEGKSVVRLKPCA